MRDENVRQNPKAVSFCSIWDYLIDAFLYITPETNIEALYLGFDHSFDLN